MARQWTVLTTPIIVNTTIDNDQEDARFAVLPDGNLFGTWESNDTQRIYCSLIRGGIINTDGVLSAPDFAFHANFDTILTDAPNSSYFNPEIFELGNGNVLITCAGSYGGFGRNQLLGRIFDAQGNAIADDFVIPTPTSSTYVARSVTALDNGGVAVFYSADYINQIDAWTYMQIIRPDGSLAPGVVGLGRMIDHERQFVELDSGDFLVTYERVINDSVGLYGKIFNRAGRTVEPEFVVMDHAGRHESALIATQLADGNILYAWNGVEPNAGAAEYTDIYGMVRDVNGTVVVREFRINSDSEGSQRLQQVIQMADGNFLIYWAQTHFNQPIDQPSTFGFTYHIQRIDQSGHRVGAQFNIPLDRSFDVDDVRLTLLDDGRILVSYTDSGFNGDRLGSSVNAMYIAITDDITGTARSETLASMRDLSILRGLAGHDTLLGQSGMDTLDGGAGADSLVGGGGNDTYILRDSLDTIVEREDGGFDKIMARVSVTMGRNVEALRVTTLESIVVRGNSLGNLMDGAAGRDRLLGLVGNDTIRGHDGADTLLGGMGNDSVYGGEGADSLFGGDGNDLLGGELNRDVLFGGAGDDTLIGTMDGDVLFGGAGADHFAFNADARPFGNDSGIQYFGIVRDFVFKQNDVIDLSALDAQADRNHDQAFTFIGSRPLSGREGELRFLNGVLYGQIDRNFDIDLVIVVANVEALTAVDLIL